MKKTHRDEATTFAKMEEGHTPSVLEPTSEVAPSIVPSSSDTEVVSSASDVVIEIAPLTSDVMMLTLVGNQQSLTQATEPIISEVNHGIQLMFARVACFAQLGEENQSHLGM
ncbi:uncharacterized protein A4U43_C07F27890 [Asparagus officinalis]|uniref:Uncharacterized protein n=1 Tax=Asparagus officinalis TaxID=4686 RepID=A0A5P1EFE6_ASPOF|nr:uncharacterized protein A4U43_C07F27890 [Asparagus officinalis]